MKKQEEKIAKGENPNGRLFFLFIMSDLSIDQPPSNETGILASKTRIF